MKTNKAEREAIASKFIKRMEEKMVFKNKDFKSLMIIKRYPKIMRNLKNLKTELAP